MNAPAQTSAAASATTAPAAATTAAPDPHAHDLHDDHDHDSEMIWFWLAAAESVVYSVFVFVMYQGWFAPVVRGGIETAVITTAHTLGAMAILGMLHVYVQKKLEVYRPGHEASRTLKMIDVLSSFLPLLAFGLAMFIASRVDGEYTAWWKVVRLWIGAIVVASLWQDVKPTLGIIFNGRGH